MANVANPKGGVEVEAKRRKPAVILNVVDGELALDLMNHKCAMGVYLLNA